MPAQLDPAHSRHLLPFVKGSGWDQRGPMCLIFLRSSEARARVKQTLGGPPENYFSVGANPRTENWKVDMARWEYRVLHDLPAHELNELGEEGWEFVTVEFDDEGEILNAFAKRAKGGGGGSGGGGGGGGGRSRRRRRGGKSSGSGHAIGPMT